MTSIKDLMNSLEFLFISSGIVHSVILNHNFQLNEALEFIDTMKNKYGLSASNLTFTGHSLGGILSQGIGAKLQIPVFAFNPMGTSKLELNTINYEKVA